MELSRTHRKISAGCIVLIILCTLGFNIAFTKAAASTTETAEKITQSFEESEKQHEILEKAETKDGKAEIIKHIQRVNNDGTYTVGYEADDGTFKIESRDVLGNVKGTYGYVDNNGEIKRVSYTANNGTGLKNNQQTSSEEVRENPKFNRTLLNSTTRRPSYPSSASSTTPNSRGTVIQSIPRRLRISTPTNVSEKSYSPTASPSSFSSSPKVKGDSTIGTVVYATSVPTNKAYINIRPTPLPGKNIRHQPSEQQLSRPEKLEIDHHNSQVQIFNNHETSSSIPVTEDVDERDEDKLISRGSVLRRQLIQETDSSHLYGPSSGLTRNLPSTTSKKLPALVLAARQRASQIQSSLNSHSFQNENTYTKVSDNKNSRTADDPTTESTTEHSYLTQNPVQNQIPASKFVNQQPEQENRVLRKSEHRPPQFIRIQPGQNVRTNAPQFVRIPLPQNGNENEQYLRETTPVSSKPETFAEQDPVGVHAPQHLYYRRPQQETYPPDYYYPSSQPRQQLREPIREPIQKPPISLPQQPQRTQSTSTSPQDQMSGFYPMSTPVPFYYRGPTTHPPPPPAPYYNGYPQRPLTTRDFERLLQLLILRHQYLQRISNPYNPYDPYYGDYQFQRPQIPPPFYGPYDGRIPYPPIPITPYSDHETMYQAQNQVPQSEGAPQRAYELQRTIPRKKQYSPRYFGAQNNQVDDYNNFGRQNSQNDPNYLPPDVREELLYRMLMLALESEQSVSTPVVTTAGSNSLKDIESTSSTTMKSASSIGSFRKPVRSVQILGEENN